MMNKNTAEIHTALEELKKQLERINSASQQIEEVKEIAQSITTNMLDLQKKYQKHLEILKDDHYKSNEKHKAILNNQLIENDEAHKKLIANTDAKIARIDDIFKSNISSLEKDQSEQRKVVDEHLLSLKDNYNQSSVQNKELLNKYLEGNKNEYSKLILNTDEKISEINEVFESNIRKSEEIQKVQSESIDEHLKIYDSFVEDVKDLTLNIKKVDFPSRLEKLDNTVSAINLGIQNTQTAIASSERNINDKIDKQIEKIQDQYELTTKTNNTIKLSIWLLGAINIIFLIIIVLKLLR